MKKLKFLFLLFLLLLFTSDVFAQTYVFSKNRLVKVYSSTFTAANARCSYVDGTAFVWAEGLDLSAYAGTDLGSTPYLIRLEDASGDVAWGYAGAVGGGETLGAELMTDSTFDVGIPPWSVTDASITVSGGQAVFTSTPNTKAIYQATTTPLKKLFKLVVDTVAITSGNAVASIGIFTSGNLSAGTNTIYGVAPTTAGNASLKASGGVFSGTINDFSVKQVTDCAATGLHIMSAKNGTTRNWASIGATFGYNDAMKYSIYRIY